MTVITAAVQTPEARLRHAGPGAVSAAARAVAREWSDHAERADRSAGFPAQNIARAWAAGLGNLSLPAEAGGVGAGLGATAQTVRILAAGDSSSALILVMHLIALTAATVAGSEWSDAARRAVIESSLAGPALANHLRVEPELGTPARGGVPATRADPVTGGWSLTGHKTYCTGSYGLRWLAVWGATAQDDPAGQRIGTFLVSADDPGVSIEPTWDHLGMRASASHDMRLDAVPVPPGHAFGLRPAAGGPPPGPPPVLAAWMAVLTVSVYLGIADAARDWLVGWLQERAPSNLGAPLATLPRFQTATGEIEAQLLAASAVVDALAADVDAEAAEAVIGGVRPGLAKTVAARAAITVVQEAVALTGNPGLSRSHPLERHLRDVLCARIHTPQEDTVLLAAGQRALARGRGGR